jgi:hypothetical protein
MNKGASQGQSGPRIPKNSQLKEVTPCQVAKQKPLRQPR